MSKSEKEGLNRREVLGTGLTAVTIAGIGGLVAGGTAVMIAEPQLARADSEEDEHRKAYVPPGKLDEYYGFW